MMNGHLASRFGGADAEQVVGKSGAYDLCDGCGDEEPGESSCTIARRKPVSQVDDHTGEKPGLCEAEEEPHGVELERCFDERRRAGQDSPCDHDPANPLSRTPFFDEERTGDFEEEVADEKNAGTE